LAGKWSRITDTGKTIKADLCILYAMNSNKRRYEAFKYFLSIVSTKKRYSEIDGFFIIIFRYVSENQKVSD